MWPKKNIMKNLRHYIDLVEATDTIRPRPEDFPPQDNKSYADAFAGTERDPATGNLLSQQQLQSLGLTQAQIDAGASERARNPVAGAPTPRPSYPIPSSPDSSAPTPRPSYPIPSSPEPPTGSAALDPARNPDSNTNIPGGPQGPAGRVPPKPAKKYLPVDEKLKPIQEKLKALGYDLGPAGVDGRLGKFTKQAIDDFSSGKPPGKQSSSAGKKTADGKTKSADDENKARIEVLKKQAAEQRKAGKEEEARATEKAIVQLSGNPGETPPAKKTTPEQDKAREEALARLEKRAELVNEDFNKLTAVEQIQKIRQLVDEAQQAALLRPPPGPVADAGSSIAGKAANVAKAALGSAAKKITPGFGAFDAYSRGKEGDWLGVGLAGASTIASFFPGPGTAIALGLDAINIGRDVAAGKFDGPKPQISPQEREQVEKDWKTLEPYYTDRELFKSLPAKDQERLNKLREKLVALDQ